MAIAHCFSNLVIVQQDCRYSDRDGTLRRIRHKRSCSDHHKRSRIHTPCTGLNLRPVVRMRFSLKIPRLHIQSLNRKILDEHRLQPHDRLLRVAWIRPATTRNLVARADRQPKSGILAAGTDRSVIRSSSCRAIRCAASPSRWIRPLIGVIDHPLQSVKIHVSKSRFRSYSGANVEL